MSKKKDEPEQEPVTLTYKKRIYLFFKTLIFSLYPFYYHKFSQKRFSEGFAYIGCLLLLITIFTGILLCIKIPQTMNTIASEMDKFEKLEISADMELKKDITLAGSKLRISEDATYSNETVLLTKENINFKKPSCIMLEPLCWFGNSTKKLKTSELSNILEYKEKIKKGLKSLAIAVYPALLIFIVIVISLKTILVLILLFLLIRLLKKMLKMRLSNRQSTLISIYATTIFIVAEPVNTLLLNLYYIHLIVALVMAALGVALVGQKKHRF
ncbi:MAG: DUF1189 family protein [Nanobdellota archaeon]